MFWKTRKKGLIISSELHEKLSRNAVPIHEPDSEVLCVRSLPKVRREKNKSIMAYKPAYYYGA
ncbi:MAG: hypothetical protein V1792_06070 [Pseudomonadota bacterium]